MVARVDEPVRRYFAHAIRVGAALPARLRLSMAGRIKHQETARDGFTWTASVGRVFTGGEGHPQAERRGTTHRSSVR